MTAQALEIVEGLSGTAEGQRSLRAAAPTLTGNLVRCARSPALSRAALTALVNVSQDAAIAAALVDGAACPKLFDYLREGALAHPDLAVMLLSNLTQSEKGARSALQVRTGHALPTVAASLVRRVHSRSGSAGAARKKAK